ncbi:MAG: hypothetical protein Q8R70_04980 [Methanoregula sp.]|nr:hypothetical protein [Methanoregula sp.]
MPIGSFTHQTDLAGEKVHLNKTCTGGKCRLGPTVHVQKSSADSHDAILHGLDRKVGRLIFGKEPFEPTVGAWDTKPIVFARLHPEPKEPGVRTNAAVFGQDPEFTQDELDRINGAIIGELSDAHIESSGHPKLIVTKNYTDETAIRMFGQGLISEDQLAASQAAVPIALKLLAAGKLSHSSAFICPDDHEKLTGTVIPNHVLDFEETEVDKPVDPMSVILNKTEVNDVTPGNSHTNVGKVISRKNKGRFKELLDGISSLFEEMTSGADTPAEPESKINSETVITQGTMNEPDGESLEGQIELVRQKLTDAIGMTWPDGTPRSVWAVMTFPDKVIWQHPDTAKYYMTGYTIDGEQKITFDAPVEVEQAYVVKEANQVFFNMTASDIETIVKRNKQMETTMTPEEIAATAAAQKQKDDALVAKDAEIAQLKKERDDFAAEKAQAQKQKFDADWKNLKETVIPPGEIKDPADEVKLQKMSTEDPLAFAQKVAQWRKAPALGEEGSSHVSGPDAKTQEAADTDRILRSATGRATPGTFH